MANLTETNTYPAGVYQLERTDPVDAGVGGSGLANLQALQLASRTNYLKTVLDAVGLDLANTSLRIPAVAIASLPPASTNTRKLFYATDANAGAGVVVISNGTNWIDLRTGATVTTAATATVANASDTIAGIVRLATNAEALTGTDPNKAVTPAALQAKINAIPALGAATTSTAGTVILATNGEAITGTDAAKAVTPAALQAKINIAATTTTPGTVTLATNAEALTGTDAAKAITAAALQAKIDTVSIADASESVAGKIRLATSAEVKALTILDGGITPGALAALIPSLVGKNGQFARVNNTGDAFTYTLENTTQIITVVGGTFNALPNRYHFFTSACTVTLPVSPPEGTFIAFFNAQASGTITISATGTNAHNATLGANLRGYLVFSNGNWQNLGFSAGSFVGSGSAVFSFTSTLQSWVVPAGITSATALLWAGGGGGGHESVGGGSGFVQATFTTTPAETISVLVGEGGVCQTILGTSASAYGGGGTAKRTTAANAGAGGGRSALLRSSTELLTAGAGGGGGFSAAHFGGPGGGLTGGLGGASSAPVAEGGTQSAGGSPSNYYAGGTALAGGARFGGNGASESFGGNPGGYPGGGSGYFGGGGSDYYGAGGGSSFVGSGTTVTSTSSGAGQTAANNTHPSYASGIGNGGSVGNAGGNGRVVILWG